MADHPLLFESRSVLGPRRMDGNRLSEGKGCPPNVIIGTDGSGLSALDAGAIGGMGAGTGLALATTARPKAEGAVEPSMDEPHQNRCHPLQPHPVDVWVREAHAARHRTTTA